MDFPYVPAGSFTRSLFTAAPLKPWWRSPRRALTLCLERSDPPLFVCSTTRGFALPCPGLPARNKSSGSLSNSSLSLCPMHTPQRPHCQSAPKPEDCIVLIFWAKSSLIRISTWQFCGSSFLQPEGFPRTARQRI